MLVNSHITRFLRICQEFITLNYLELHTKKKKYNGVEEKKTEKKEKRKE